MDPFGLVSLEDDHGLSFSASITSKRFSDHHLRFSPPTCISAHTRPRSLTAPWPTTHDEMTTFETQVPPGSPPELDTSKSSKTSSFHSSSFSGQDAILSDISHFEDIGLEDEHERSYGEETEILSKRPSLRTA